MSPKERLNRAHKHCVGMDCDKCAQTILDAKASIATLRAELAGKARQIHRLQSGQDIEGDHVPEYVSNEEHMQALAELADLRAQVEALRVESDDRRERLHDTAHILIEKIGAPSGPENADSVAQRAASRITELEAQLAERDRTIGRHSEEIDRLKYLINRDRTGLAAALNAVRSELTAWGWLADAGQWGSYEWHERTVETLRREIAVCWDALVNICESGLRESGRRANEAFHSKAALSEPGEGGGK